MKIALDTNVIISLVKERKLDLFVSKYDACAPVVVEYEYIRGETKAGIDINESKETFENTFEILELNNESVKIASKIWSELSKKGRLIDERDLLIGAICIAHNVPLWTLNISHFLRLLDFGLVLVEIDLNTLKIIKIHKK